MAGVDWLGGVTAGVDWPSCVLPPPPPLLLLACWVVMILCVGDASRGRASSIFCERALSSLRGMMTTNQHQKMWLSRRMCRIDKLPRRAHGPQYMEKWWVRICFRFEIRRD